MGLNIHLSQTTLVSDWICLLIASLPNVIFK